MKTSSVPRDRYIPSAHRSLQLLSNTVTNLVAEYNTSGGEILVLHDRRWFIPWIKPSANPGRFSQEHFAKSTPNH